MEDAIAYVKSYGYIDDERYVRNYIEYRAGTEEPPAVGTGTAVPERGAAGTDSESYEIWNLRMRNH